MCTVLAPVGLIFFLVGIALLVIPVGVCFLRRCSGSHLVTHRTQKQGTHNNYGLHTKLDILNSRVYRT